MRKPTILAALALTGLAVWGLMGCSSDEEAKEGQKASAGTCACKHAKEEAAASKCTCKAGHEHPSASKCACGHHHEEGTGHVCDCEHAKATACKCGRKAGCTCKGDARKPDCSCPKAADCGCKK